MFKLHYRQVSFILLCFVVIYFVLNFSLVSADWLGINAAIDTFFIKMQLALISMYALVVSMLGKTALFVSDMAFRTSNGFIELLDQDFRILKDLWVIVRDVVNVFITLAFIFVAISYTIGTSAFSGSPFRIKKTILGLIVVALVVNFSAFITLIIVDASNILAVLAFHSGNLAPLFFYLAIPTNADISSPALIGLIFIITPFILLACVLLFLIGMFILFRFLWLLFAIVISPVGLAGIILTKFNEGEEWLTFLVTPLTETYKNAIKYSLVCPLLILIGMWTIGILLEVLFKDASSLFTPVGAILLIICGFLFLIKELLKKISSQGDGGPEKKFNPEKTFFANASNVSGSLGKGLGAASVTAIRNKSSSLRSRVGPQDKSADSINRGNLGKGAAAKAWTSGKETFVENLDENLWVGKTVKKGVKKHEERREERVFEERKQELLKSEHLSEAEKTSSRHTESARTTNQNNVKTKPENKYAKSEQNPASSTTATVGEAHNDPQNPASSTTTTGGEAHNDPQNPESPTTTTGGKAHNDPLKKFEEIDRRKQKLSLRRAELEKNGYDEEISDEAILKMDDREWGDFLNTLNKLAIARKNIEKAKKEARAQGMKDYKKFTQKNLRAETKKTKKPEAE